MLWIAMTLAGTETLTTRDDVALVADVHLGEPGAPGVVLLHMIPPHWDRSSWPAAFVSGLHQRGWSVCVVDRRGAGDSKGKPKQAYEGEKGRYDVEACVKRLQRHGLGPLAVIGASNGTTSMIDYASWAGSESLPTPVWLGFMTGGTYTENNTSMKTVREIPSVFTFSTAERAWSVKQTSTGVYTHHEFPKGKHGTKMFEVEPTVSAVLLDAMTKAFAKR